MKITWFNTQDPGLSWATRQHVEEKAVPFIRELALTLALFSADLCLAVVKGTLALVTRETGMTRPAQESVWWNSVGSTLLL